MSRALKIALVPVGFGLAFLAFVNAASGVGLPIVSSDTPLLRTIAANVQEKVVERDLALEMRDIGESNPAAGMLDFPRISEGLRERATQSYAVDPLQVSTLATIAVGDVAHSDEERARQIMQTAGEISRRNPLTNLWLAQDYGQRGDLDNALIWFDHALRTSLRARSAVIDPVVRLSATPASYSALVDLLEARPDWEISFWNHFIRDDIALQNSGRFFTETGIPLDRMSEEQRQVLFQNLEQASLFENLSQLAKLDPATKQSAEDLAQGKMVTVEDGDPFGWRLFSSGNFVAVEAARRGFLEIDAQPGSFGLAGQRLVTLDGSYVMSIRLAEPLAQGSSLKLTTVCKEGTDGALAEIEIQSGMDGGQVRFDAGECRFAAVELSFRVDQSASNTLFDVSEIRLRPAG